MKRADDVRRKMIEWQEMNTSYLKEIKTLVSETKAAKDFQVISYFTYSLNISHEQGRENFILGSYHIQNLGGIPLSNPFICIKVSEDSPFDFSGKYLNKDTMQKMNLPNAWERMNDAQDKQEFWLKPASISKLEPKEILSFSNFQVKWTPESSYAGSIMGFTYGDEMENGMNAFNQINIGGSIGEVNEHE